MLANRSSDAQPWVAIAELGGFLAHEGDGDPGPTVIWIGWTVLQNAARLDSPIFISTCR